MLEDLQKDIELRKETIKETYERSMAYANLIIVAGYAGIFTLWTLTNDNLTKESSFLTGFLLGISIFVFCAWEVFKMIFGSIDLKNKVEMLNSVTSFDELKTNNEKLKIQANKRILRLYSAWYLVLIITILTGFGAALLLFYNFIAGIFNLPFWPK